MCIYEPICEAGELRIASNMDIDKIFKKDKICQIDEIKMIRPRRENVREKNAKHLNHEICIGVTNKGRPTKIKLQDLEQDMGRNRKAENRRHRKEMNGEKL